MATNDINNSENTLTLDQTQPDVENTADQNNDKQTLKRAAAVAGVGIGASAIGAGGMAVAQNLMDGEVEAAIEVDDTINSSGTQGVTDDMPFDQAFDTARAELGPGGIFHWHGQAYNTYTKEEWDQMSAEERTAYADRVSDNISSEERANYQAHQQHAEHHNEHVQASTVTNSDDNPATQAIVGSSESNSDVVIIGMQDVQTEDGQVVTVGAVRIDDYDVVVVDSNHDGTFDIAAADANHNGQFDQDEYMSLEDQNITVESLQRMEHHNDMAARQEIMGNVPNDDDNTVPDTDYLANNDMPDYSQDYDADDTFIA